MWIFQEQPDKKPELDDDEDRKNPAFIPRKGAFYEHDLRLGDDTSSTDVDNEQEKLRFVDVAWYLFKKMCSLIQYEISNKFMPCHFEGFLYM